MARDIQMRLVYAWEREAYPGYFDKARSVGVPEARELIRKVHADVLAAGGFAHEAPVVKFTKRNGSACASWGRLKFTPSMLTPEIVLHEIAHSLTWNPTASREAMRWSKNLRTPMIDHALRRLCTQGHGPRYVACFIALCERYAGHSADAALALARGFHYQAWGPWRTVRAQAEGGSPYMRERAKVTKFGSVRVDAEALAYWRALLA